jgi:hypothetical protein
VLKSIIPLKAACKKAFRGSWVQTVLLVKRPRLVRKRPALIQFIAGFFMRFDLVFSQPRLRPQAYSVSGVLFFWVDLLGNVAASVRLVSK